VVGLQLTAVVDAACVYCLLYCNVTKWTQM